MNDLQSTGLSQDALGGLAVGGVFGVIATITLVLYVIRIIAYWKIFKKMGEPGWKSIIPIYSDYIMYKKTWKPMWFWITLAVSFVLCLASQAMGTPDAPVATGGMLVFATIVTAVFTIVAIVLSVIALHKISKSFGHGAGFTVGLIFLSLIFVLVLAFGSSQYVGPNGGTGVKAQD